MRSLGLFLALTIGLGQTARAAPASHQGADPAAIRALIGADSVPRDELGAWLESEVAEGRRGAAVGLLLEAARSRLRGGDSKGAVDLLEVALRAGPGDARLLSPLGRAYSHLRDYRAAEEVLRQAVAAGDSSATTLVFLGDALWENARFEEAERVYRQALETGGRPADALAQLGRLLLWQGRYDEAAPMLREAVAKRPGAIDVRLDLADALKGAGRDEEAIKAFREVVRASPELLRARYGLARLLAKVGEAEASKVQYEEYERLYRAAQERALEKERREGDVALARHLLDDGRAEEALTHLTSLEETVDVLELKSRVLEVLGRREEALSALRRAVVLEPGRAELRRRLAELSRSGEGGR